MRPKLSAFALLIGALLVGGVTVAAPARRNPKEVGGWGKAKWGMSSTQLVAAMSPKVLLTPVNGDPLALLSGFSIRLIKDVDVGGSLFGVRLVLRGNKLYSVVMTDPDGVSLHTAKAETLFRSLSQALSEKYGTPVVDSSGNEPSKIPTSEGRDAWESGIASVQARNTAAFGRLLVTFGRWGLAADNLRTLLVSDEAARTQALQLGDETSRRKYEEAMLKMKMVGSGLSTRRVDDTPTPDLTYPLVAISVSTWKAPETRIELVLAAHAENAILVLGYSRPEAGAASNL